MNPVNALTSYLRSAKEELEKVSWPTRQDTIRYSSLVLGVSLLVAAFFASLDFGLNRLVDAALQQRSAASEQTIPTTPTPSNNTVPGLDVQPVSGVQVQGADGSIIPTK